MNKSPDTLEDSIEEQQFLHIPLINKKPNSVEKYISQYEPNDLPRLPRRTEVPLSTPLRPERHLLVFETPLRRASVPVEEEQRCFVRYQRVNDQSSGLKLELLAKVESDYARLKKKMQPTVERRRKSIYNTSEPANESIGSEAPRKVGLPSRTMALRSDAVKVSLQEIEKSVKTSMINENGKLYFADLYLLKKGRDELISGLSNAGRHVATRNELTYEEKVQTEESNFVSGRILEERNARKKKMMKMRSPNWNVYYEMLALSNEQKRKVTEMCKFSHTYGMH